jgi:low temperature requirement protein LtrA
LAPSSVSSPDNQSVTWVELFFDIIFVFSITQLVGLLHSGITWTSIGQGVLVFWLIWWGWSQYTWALNAANTRHKAVELATLLGGLLALVMSVAIHDVFTDTALWFAITYVMVRAIGLWLSIWASNSAADQKKVFISFAMASSGGLIFVLVGALAGGAAQYWFWGGAIAFDMFAAQIGNRAGHYQINVDHFIERHGLFVIIVIGESLLVAAAGVTGHEWTTSLTLVAATSLVLTFSLWWSYFAHANDKLESAIESSGVKDVASLLRDVFSMMHIPMILGLIGVVVAIEESIAHPDAVIHTEVRIALGVGILLFVGGMGFATKRAGGDLPIPRIAISAVAALAIVFVDGVDAYITLLIGVIALATIGVVEHLMESSSTPDEVQSVEPA